MKCPICGAWTEIVTSSYQSVGYVRQRVCGNEHKFKTLETQIPSVNHGGARFKAGRLKLFTGEFQPKKRD